MKVVGNKNKKSKKKSPLRIILDSGRKIPVPSQHDFKDSFIRNHGCSLVAFYMALRFRGKKKNVHQCLDYARKHLKCSAKYSLKELCKGINQICSKGSAVYKTSLTNEQLMSHLKKGQMVLFEERNPIHTVVLLYDANKKQVLRFSDGKKNVTTAAKENAKRCTSNNYKGIVIVK